MGCLVNSNCQSHELVGLLTAPAIYTQSVALERRENIRAWRGTGYYYADSCSHSFPRAGSILPEQQVEQQVRNVTSLVLGCLIKFNIEATTSYPSDQTGLIQCASEEILEP